MILPLEPHDHNIPPTIRQPVSPRSALIFLRRKTFEGSA